jgi:hypothetical protein
VLGLLLAAISCRSILDINPGKPLEDGAGAEGIQSGGKTSTTGGTQQAGGDSSGSANGGNAKGGNGSGGAAKGGSSQGGTTSLGNAGDSATAGSGGDGTNPPPSPFPVGPCLDCIARDCPTEQQACANDAACTQGVPGWLGCTKPVAGDCVDSKAGPLHDVEACGAESCDLCRHLSDNQPSIEILTPSSGASLTLDATGLIEVSVRVRNVQLKGLGTCGTDTACGHVHLNLDGANCHNTPFYNAWITSAAADGSADSAIDTKYCVQPILGRKLALSASLSAYNGHADRVPQVQATVTVTLSK